MGVLVNYKFDDLSEDDVRLIGSAIGKLSIETGLVLHLKLQGQINAQEAAAVQAARADKAARDAAAREAMRAEIIKEIPPAPRRRKRRA